MPLVSRKASPDHPCRLYQGELGCFTTGWQDFIELTPAIERAIKRDRLRGTLGIPYRFETAVQQLFKRHARSMPKFLGSGYEHESRDHANNIAITTECSSGAPTWDLNRPGRYFHEQCNLYTRISHL